jgi:hypothetical protein
LALVVSSFRGGLGDVYLCASGAELQQSKEYKLKAALIARLIQYVKWPKNRFITPKDPFVVGVLGKDPFGKDLPKCIGALKSYRGHPLKLKYFKDSVGLERCHVLFVTNTQRRKLKPLFSQLEQACVLLIGEEDGFAARGGVINFYWKDKTHLGFEVNLDAAKRQDLSIRSELLKLARIVKEER